MDKIYLETSLRFFFKPRGKICHNKREMYICTQRIKFTQRNKIRVNMGTEDRTATTYSVNFPDFNAELSIRVPVGFFYIAHLVWNRAIVSCDLQ